MRAPGGQGRILGASAPIDAAMRCLRVLGSLLIAGLVTQSCASDPESEPQFSPSQLDSKITSACESQFRSAVLQVHAAKSCATEADCAFRPSNGIMTYEHCRMGNYVNPSAAELSGQALEQLNQLETELESCLLPVWTGIGCIGHNPTPPMCWRGRCWLDPLKANAFELVSADACFATASPGACSECMCATCPALAAACFADADCSALFECTAATGAFGRYARLSFGMSNPPCPDLLNELGGAEGETAEQVEGVAQCIRRSGCFPWCDGA